MSCARSTIARRHGCSITARGGGTSQAGPGDRRRPSARHVEVLQPRSLEVNVGRAMGACRAGIVLDELNARSAAARTALRAGHLDRQPRHRRRHDREQLRAARGRCCTARRSITCSIVEVVLSDGSRRALPVRSMPTELDARVRRRHASRRRAIEPFGELARDACGRNRATVSESAAPRRRLQPRRVRRSAEARSTSPS